MYKNYGFVLFFFLAVVFQASGRTDKDDSFSDKIAQFKKQIDYVFPKGNSKVNKSLLKKIKQFCRKKKTSFKHKKELNALEKRAEVALLSGVCNDISRTINLLSNSTLSGTMNSIHNSSNGNDKHLLVKMLFSNFDKQIKNIDNLIIYIEKAQKNAADLIEKYPDQKRILNIEYNSLNGHKEHALRCKESVERDIRNRNFLYAGGAGFCCCGLFFCVKGYI